MTSVLIALLLITVCASAAVHVMGWLRDRAVPEIDLPPLLLPLADALRAQPEAPQLAATEPPPVDREQPDDDGMDAAETVHLPRPTEEAVQLLPARLEVVAGMPRRQEIRFVRTPGRPPQMILGRAPGGSPQHVTLTSSTVSRRHARVAFTDGKWKVVNLSTTNPVVVNDRALSGKRSERVLTDGDTIELGDVVLRFRAS